MILIGSVVFSGCSILQPVVKETSKFNFIDMDAPALRIAKPVQAELLEKVINTDGSVTWQSLGVGVIPAGAYVKGRRPPDVVQTK